MAKMDAADAIVGHLLVRAGIVDETSSLCLKRLLKSRAGFELLRTRHQLLPPRLGVTVNGLFV